MLPHRVNESITLRILQNHHSEALFALTDRNRAHLREWLPWLDETTTIEHSREFIRSALKAFTESAVFAAGIWHRDVFCGVIAYNFIDWEKRIAYPGYWLSEDHQGLGIITECCRALIRHAFEEYQLNQIIIHVATGNSRSQAIPERLGFRQEGIKPQAEWLYDHHVDHSINVLHRP